MQLSYLSDQKRYVPFLSLRKRRTADHRQVAETLVSAGFDESTSQRIRTSNLRFRRPTPVGHFIRLGKPAKPRPDFPLFPLANGRWAKKVWQRPIYFGKWVDDPKGVAALDLWLDQKDDLPARRTHGVAIRSVG